MAPNKASFVGLSCFLALAPVSIGGAPPSQGFQYGEFWQQSLELYMPNTCAPPPLVVFIHGGGWLSGDALDVWPYTSSLMDRGFAVASLNYTWSFNGEFPAQIHDCKGAVRWLRANAAALGYDASNIAVFGDSAGGHLAALLGTSAGVAELEGDVGGNLEYSSAVQVVGDFYGPTDLLALGADGSSLDGEISSLFGWDIDDIAANQANPAYADLVALVESANPINHITPGDPVFKICHGTDDDIVPISQSELLNSALQSSGVSSSFLTVPGFGHKLPDWTYQNTFDLFEQFLKPNPTMAGDSNCDLDVDVDDLLTVINHWGICPDPPKGFCNGDFLYDGDVDVDDLLIVINNWG